MKTTIRLLNIQYSLLQATYWGIVCTLSGGFTSVFLLSRGFTNTQVGITVAVGNVLGVILQPVLASLVDDYKKIALHTLTGLLAIVAVVGMGALLFTENIFIATLGVFILTFSLIQTLQSFCNAISMFYINQGISVNFGIARGCGSAFYAVVSTLLGTMVEQYGFRVILIWAVSLTVIFGLLVFWMRAGVDTKMQSFASKPGKASCKEEMAASTAKKGVLQFFSRYKGFSVLLLGVVFIFIFHSMSNNFMFQIMQRIGGDSKTLGIALSIAAIVELPVMAGFFLLSKRFAAHQLLRFSGVLFAIKAISYLFASNVTALYFCQLLQMGSYAVFIPASVFYVNELMEESDMVKGQAFVVSACTLGGVFASMLGGFLIDQFGVYTMLMFQAGAAVLGTVLFFLAPTRKNMSESLEKSERNS